MTADSMWTGAEFDLPLSACSADSQIYFKTRAEISSGR